MIAIDILREEMHKANGHLTVWQEDWIVKAMERYAEQQVENYSTPDEIEQSEELVSFLRQYQKSCEIMHVNKIDAKNFVEQYKTIQS